MIIEREFGGSDGEIVNVYAGSTASDNASDTVSDGLTGTDMVLSRVPDGLSNLSSPCRRCCAAPAIPPTEHPPARRYGTAASFVVRGKSAAQPIKAAVEELIALLREDGEALGCVNDVLRAPAILARGSSADAQLEVYRAARNAGRSRAQALTEVIDWIRRTTAEP